MHHARAMARRPPAQMPAKLRARLEAARLDLLALFRALDRMDLSAAEIPQRLMQQLLELDADYAEALWALDQPLASLDLPALLRDTRDTLAALKQLNEACARFRRHLPPRAHSTLNHLETTVRKSLDPAEAYNMVPGRDPYNGQAREPPPGLEPLAAVPVAA